MGQPKIIYFGTDEFVVAPLEALIKVGCEIMAVVTASQYSSIAKYAAEHHVNLLVPQSLKEEAFFEEFKQLEPDICIVASYGKIIPQRYLEIPKHGFLNIHPSLLPKYRGPSPIPAPLLAGDTRTGVTIIKMDAEMDHGPIVAQQEVVIEPDDNFSTLINKLFHVGAKLLVDTFPNYLLSEVEPRSQKHELATYTKLLKTEDAEIKFDNSVEFAMRKIRALNPEPGTFVFLTKSEKEKVKSNKIRLKILEAEKIEEYDEKKPILKLKDGYLLLKKVQPEGKKPMSGEDFLGGYGGYLKLG